MTARDQLLQQYAADADAAALLMAERLTSGDLHAVEAATAVVRLAVGHPCTNPAAEAILKENTDA